VSQEVRRPGGQRVRRSVGKWVSQSVGLSISWSVISQSITHSASVCLSVRPSVSQIKSIKASCKYEARSL